MINQEIKTECEKAYEQISLAQDRLKELRTICKHEHTTDKPYAWRVGATATDKTKVCDYCGENCGAITTVYMPITSIGMSCEKENCQNEGGKDYKRNESEFIDGWEGEPIFLCDEHSDGHKLD